MIIVSATKPDNKPVKSVASHKSQSDTVYSVAASKWHLWCSSRFKCHNNCSN